MEKYLTAADKDKESVPPMLKPSAKIARSILSDENLIKSGQESMETFLKMSQSKGIDSFINLGEPEFSEPLMNMSQPSILYTSIISPMNNSIKDDIMVTNRDTMAQQIVYQHSDLEEKLKSCDSTNETFITRRDDNDVISSNKTHRANSLNDTYCKEFAQSDRGLNETYNTILPDEPMLAPSTSSLCKKIHAATLYCTYITEPNADANFAQLKNKGNNDVKLDVTYLSSMKKEQDVIVLNKNDARKLKVRASETNLNITCDIPQSEYFNETESVELFEMQDVEDMSFKMPVCSQSTPINPNTLNPMSKLSAKNSDQPRQILCSMLKAPTSLRRELLTEIRRSGECGLDATYKHMPHNPDLKDTKENVDAICDDNVVMSETEVFPIGNRYDTYKKSALTTNQCKSRNAPVTVAQRESASRKFYTFTKKNNNFVEKTGDRNTIENTISGKNIEVAHRSNMDDTFRKPLPKAPKRNVPRMLSRLPQFLQKSNPNLASSSLKNKASISDNASIFNIDYMKGSQPNMQNMERLLPNKLHLFNKLKSGSEQRLVDVNVNNASEFSTKNAIGSTESIESTQSVQSAPDLDDRLSTCSDSSQNSCNRRTMNIEQLHQLVRMQEESKRRKVSHSYRKCSLCRLILISRVPLLGLKQDSPLKSNRQILENTWVEAKTDLPSPILKNGIEHEIDTNSPVNDDSAMKCSSPIMNSTGSSHALNNEGN